ncbi:3-phosphoshikimate 1-carboxyvinyltransferase, partial [archaeon]|nr:3-phosphoshikimate 1-carboxyvinyltransferase [archaeon]
VAAPYAKKDVEIKSIGHLSSKLFTDVTIQSMKDFGVETTHSNYELFKVKSGQQYTGREIIIEGDFSNSAYFFIAAAIHKGKVTVTGLNKNSIQGDKYIIELLQLMGCKFSWKNDSVTIKGADLKGIGDIDMNAYPDIVMPLAIAAAFAEGTTRITNIAHLKFKESNRLTSTVQGLTNLGADASCDNDSITIHGKADGKNLHSAIIDSHNDHRIAMSLTIAGLKIPGVTIKGKEAVNKSFPEFFEEIVKIIQR